MNGEWGELPEGWEVKPLGDICEITGGGTPRREEAKYFGGPIPWATPTDIHAEKILPISRTKSTITELGLKESSAHLLKPGTVLFSSRASIGKIAIASVPMATNQGFANLTPRDGLDSKFLAYGLRYFTDNIEKLGSGTTFIEVPKSALREFEFPLPPLPEQHRLVSKIERLFAESRTAREALERVPALLKRFRQAVLAKAFRGDLTPLPPSPDRKVRGQERGEGPGVGGEDEPASALLERIRAERRRKWEETHHLSISSSAVALRTAGDSSTVARTGKGKKVKYVEPEPPDTSDLPELPEGWSYTLLEPLLSTVRAGMKTGPFGSLLKKHEHRPTGVPVLGIENIGRMKFIPGSKIHITKGKAEQLPEYDAQPGDILISRSGTVGEVCVVPQGVGDARISTNTIRIVLQPNGMLPSFLGYMFNGAQHVLDQVNEMCKGTTRAFLNQKILTSIVFPLPPLAEQRRIIAKIESLFAQAEAIEKAVAVARRRAEKVDQAVLARAFRGEL